LNSHVVATDDVETQRHLLHAGMLREYPLVALFQNDVRRLIESSQPPLRSNKAKRSKANVTQQIKMSATNASLAAHAMHAINGMLTTIVLPSFVITRIISASHPTTQRIPQSTKQSAGEKNSSQ
jgi:hypothetical protein